MSLRLPLAPSALVRADSLFSLDLFTNEDLYYLIKQKNVVGKSCPKKHKVQRLLASLNKNEMRQIFTHYTGVQLKQNLTKNELIAYSKIQSLNIVKILQTSAKPVTGFCSQQHLCHRGGRPQCQPLRLTLRNFLRVYSLLH